ncbi:Uncharacterised protein [Zhongshania aliphaticivorans]|uniref:Uncharacterized protein n=1 Tax=Zhongshania aliphaticivorans TaxID=1470434 RepID=A0A5S9P190_9GAMM|nr:hypothetical protein [Zhongshania aliphaticivorans]CAA0089759.1 Uncharacterised protein [Zhongshania aliphaticivorans]CAA0096733.1 Uncharacterised protein [Zhongshania aliphaticivorans]
MINTQEKTFVEELDDRLLSFFRDQSEGFDIPPAVLYRLEGFIEAGLVLGFINPKEIKRRLYDLAIQYGGEEAGELYHNDERIILHVLMPEAPVYPSTKS